MILKALPHDHPKPARQGHRNASKNNAGTGPKMHQTGTKMEPQMGPQNGPQMGPTNCPTNSSETPSANSVWRTPFWMPGELQKCHFGTPESFRMLENQEGVGFQKIRRRIWSGTPLKFVGQFCRAHSSGQFWGRFWPYLGADFPPRWARFWEPFQDPFSACGKTDTMWNDCCV